MFNFYSVFYVCGTCFLGNDKYCSFLPFARTHAHEIKWIKKSAHCIVFVLWVNYAHDRIETKMLTFSPSFTFCDRVGEQIRIQHPNWQKVVPSITVKKSILRR